MDNNDHLIPQNHYVECILTIHGIKFTQREIDVIACILHTRGSSKIASLLSISSRTVETHTANIMRKMDTNSREGIIDFIEKHGHFLFISKHYQVLLLYNIFKKKLKEINYIIKNQRISLYFIYDTQEKEDLALISCLENTFASCGITTIHYDQSRDRELKENILAIKNDNLVHVLHFISQTSSLQDPLKDKDYVAALYQLIPHADLSSLPSTYVFLNHESTPLQNSKDIRFGKACNYYSSFFKLLKEIVDHPKLDDITNDFGKFQEPPIQQSDMDIPPSDIAPDVDRRSILFMKKLGNLMVISSLFIGVFYLGTYLVSHYKLSGFSRSEARSNASIRSDLVVPAEHIFLNRPAIMAKIDESLKGNSGIQSVAIVGIGGAGKSTIARQYGLKQKSNIVWEINATTRDTMMVSFERLAYALSKTEAERNIIQGIQNIKNDRDRREKIIWFVKRKLKSTPNWFLIYDNVEKFTNIKKFFPCDSHSWGDGKIIITTSNSNTANNNIIHKIIHIGELSPKEKLDLFLKIMRKENQNFDTVQEQQVAVFLNEIPPFPLDVSLAAYYLKSTNTPYEKYLVRLKEDNKDFETFQTDVVIEASGYTKTRYTIITLSLMELINANPDFKDLLLLVGLVDYKNIPTALLANLKGDTVVDTFIYNLKKYSLITNESLINTHNSISLHKSTQATILAYLVKSLKVSNESPLLQLVGNSVEQYVVDAIDKEDFYRMKLLVPHCEALLSHSHLISDTTQGMIGGALGCVFYYLRHHMKAKHLLEDNIERLSHDSKTNPETIARLLTYLGSFYRSIGDYEKAKVLLIQALAMYKHTSTNHRMARALGYLGTVYRDLGEYKKAKSLLKQSFIIYDADHKNQIGHAWIMAQLGHIYMILGKYQKSNRFLEKSLAIYKKQGEDYIGVSWVFCHLGSLHTIMGDYQTAQKYLEQSLAITRKYFPDDHLFIAIERAALGNLHIHKREYQDALKHLTASQVILEKNYGISHIETAHVLRLIGEAHCIEGDLDTAEDFIRKSLLVFQQKKYPERYQSLNSLADLYLKKAAEAANEGNPKNEKDFKLQAIRYLNQSLEIINDNFERNSPHAANIQEKLQKFKVLSN